MPTSTQLNPEQKRAQLILWVADMSKDEVRVAHMFIAKFMGEGRREYGSLNLKTETRTIAQIKNEAADEVADGLFYTFVKMMMEMDLASDEELPETD
jgi:hypothetical protein